MYPQLLSQGLTLTQTGLGQLVFALPLLQPPKQLGLQYCVTKVLEKCEITPSRGQQNEAGQSHRTRGW